jgi:hypothetical protein
MCLSRYQPADYNTHRLLASGSNPHSPAVGGAVQFNRSLGRLLRHLSGRMLASYPHGGGAGGLELGMLEPEMVSCSKGPPT